MLYERNISIRHLFAVKMISFLNTSVLKNKRRVDTFSGILVFDGASDKSWRVLHSSMFPHPDQATYKVSLHISI